MKRLTIYRIVYGIVLLLGIISVTIFLSSELEYNRANQSKLHRIELTGTFVTGEDQTPRELTMEALEEVGATEYLTVTGHLSDDIEANEQMFLYLKKISVEVYQNDKLIYSYGGEGTHPVNVKSAGNIWTTFFTDGIVMEDEFTLKFHNPYSKNSRQVYALCLQRLYVGDKMQLFLHMVEESYLTVIFALLMLLLGVVLVITATTLRRLKISGVNNVFYCGMLFFLSSIWLLIDYKYITLLLPYGITLDVIDMVVTLCIPITAMRYVRSYMRTKVRNVFADMELGLWIVCGGYLVLQQMGIVDSEMMKSSFYMVFPAIMVIVVICLILELIASRDADSRIVFVSAIVLEGFAMISYVTFQVTAVYGGASFGIGLMVFAVAQYVIVIRHIHARFKEAIRVREMENELLESRVAIMLSQIQPHFLYNSISCIQELCLVEPKKAYDALAKFAHFLRGNMDSLTSTEPILFEKELRHVKNYLALEKVRFEERLSIEYDIAEEVFFIPALTIQPIVENAVRYGISKKKGGGTLKIATYRAGDEIVVEVSDDGMGFDPAAVKHKADGRSHVGMDNVRKRLKNQCGGRLEVTSSSEGTIAKIIVPKTNT